jgi:hypothetical protein
MAGITSGDLIQVLLIIQLHIIFITVVNSKLNTVLVNSMSLLGPQPPSRYILVNKNVQNLSSSPNSESLLMTSSAYDMMRSLRLSGGR